MKEFKWDPKLYTSYKTVDISRGTNSYRVENWTAWRQMGFTALIKI